VRSSPLDWREKSYRWFTRKPLPSPVLVFTDDPQFPLVEPDEWLAPPERLLAEPEAVRATAILEPERIRIDTNRVGHPILVKVSYHPRWKADHADGPFLVSPALMLIVPHAEQFTLTYAGRDASDAVGMALSLGALAFVAWRLLEDRRAAQKPREPRMPRALTPAVLEMCEPPPPPRRWGWAFPVSILAVLVAARFVPADLASGREGAELERRADAAFRAGRFADAAEYARHALRRFGVGDPRWEALLKVRHESRVRAGERDRGLAATREEEAALGAGR
jgi:hypothetical protein